ncbi:hypothetical protein [Sporosarcina cascadiensis]|uniref:hypothetical protein n=1 Tax=Sporosarcina cascadiensis TaxID=2660747 RepID=UPI00129AE286|nr:hypothetical protein [Sporosarcina cascadiensis]
MIRKALPAVFASALVLTACNTDNGALPDNNETPMENMERDNTSNDNKRMGPNLDGLDENNGNNGGVMNEDRKGIIDDNNQNTLDENLDLDDGLMDGENGNRGARDDSTIQDKTNSSDTAPDGIIRDEDRKDNR